MSENNAAPVTGHSTAFGTAPGTPEAYRQFLSDLLGVIAYGELSAFERMSSDARFSPSLRDRAALGRLAVREYDNFERVTAYLESMGINAEDAMAPFQQSVDAFHDRTRPGDWHESLMKFYVTDAISDDFYAALGSRLDPASAELIASLQMTGSEAPGEVLFVRLQESLKDDPRLASRLALWGRRLVGEALTQAQRVVIERALPQGLDGFLSREEYDAQIRELFSQLTRNHSRRMSLLGLTA
ncbi:ferritin-like fold-containing protein [Arthrobacter sp. 3Tela_A]|uniref:ferritin-like fold-containing protein n=1 Tax=Arthrobacter sp. 3Tela_A TaxID=3093743 RepID=UPI003BB6348D